MSNERSNAFNLPPTKFQYETLMIQKAHNQKMLDTVSDTACPACGKLMTIGEMQAAGICTDCYFSPPWP